MLLKNSVIYLIGRLIPSALNFALVALYTRLMAPEEYGKYAIVYVTAIMAFNLGSMWLNMAALRLYARNENKEPYLWGLFVGFCAIMGGGIFISAIVAVWGGSREGAVLTLLGFLIFAGTAWFELNLHLMQARLDAMSYVVQNIARTALGGILGGYFGWLGWGAEGILLGTVLGLVIPAIPMSIAHWKHLRLRPAHPEALRDILAYGIPLSLSFAVQSVVNVLDRYVIQAVNGTAAFGLYAVGYDTADRIVRSLAQPLGAAALPLAIARLEKEGPEGARQQSGQNLIVLMLLSLPACLGLVAVSPELVNVVVGPAYREMAHQIVPVIALTSIFMMIRGNYLDTALHLGMKPRRQFVTMSVMLVVNSVLCVTLVLRYGPVGAAYATLFASLAGMIASFFVGRGAFRLPFMPGQVSRIVIAALTMMVVAMYLPVPGGPLVALLGKTVVGGITYAVCILILDVNGLRQRIVAFSQHGSLRGLL